MKNFIFSIIATGMVILNVDAQKLDIGNRDNYGAIHNQLIEEYKKQGKSVSRYLSKDEFINDIYLLASAKYPEVKNGADVSGLRQRFFNNLNNPNLDDNFNSNLQRLYDTKKISKVLFDNAKVIVETKSYPKAVAIISELENMNLSATDKQAIRVFKSLLHASHQYWNPNQSKVLKYCSEIADALGGLIWFYTGPFSIQVWHIRLQLVKQVLVDNDYERDKNNKTKRIHE